MGYLLETSKYKYKYVNGEYLKQEVGVGLQITESFKNGLIFHKARISFKCYCCDKEKPKNTRYLGSNWERICIDCAMGWLENSEDTIKEIMKILEDRKVELLDEKKVGRWRKEMILGVLEGGGG